MWSTIAKLFILFILLGIGAWLWDIVSDYIRQSERRDKENQKAEEARKRYPPIKNWTMHPLYKATIPFLIEKVDYFIQGAKEIRAARDMSFTLQIQIKPESVNITSNTGRVFTLYYSNIGYDKIKVGYFEEETINACKDFAIALSGYLNKYYLNENIDISDVRAFETDGLVEASVKFWIDLSNLMQRLKQV